MEIISLGYGSYPEIVHLNSSFKPNDRLLKVVMEVQRQDIEHLGNFQETYRKLTRLFPSIRRHHCCHHSEYGGEIKAGGGIPIKQADLYANIAHLAEHVIIDLVVRTSGKSSVSGVTCGYRKPISRHDLFVACPRKRLGFFAANLALEVMNNLGDGTSQKDRVEKLTRLAEMIEKGNGRRVPPAEIASHIGCSWQEAARLLKHYEKLTERKGQ